jgi:RecA-family ATPase
MKGYITAMFAPGGVSKSMFSLLSAVSVASGKPYTGETVHRQGKVWVINNEDDEPEQLRRLAGIVKHHKVDNSVLDNISLSCGYGNPYVTSTVDKEGNVVHHPNAKKIIAEAKANNVNYIIIDPFISTHQSDKNDNNSIQKVVDVLKHVAKEANVAIELVHHTRKATGGSNSEDHAGNADAGRGASSLKDACRVIATLARISQKNAKDQSIDYEHEGRFLVRLDSGKGNYSGPPESAEWFKQVSVDVGNGDTVGPHEMFDMEERRAIADSEKRQQKIRKLLSICWTSFV